MFVENLNPQLVRKFIYSLHSSVDKVQKMPEGNIRVRLLKSGLSPQPEYILSDFGCEANSYAEPSKAYVEKNWRIFLYLKFGEEYKNALFDYLSKQPRVRTDTNEP